MQTRIPAVSLTDFFASFVVFLVALPLSLGIAVASGAPPAAGLIGAAVGGIVVGLASGAPLQVSGPAAGLTVMVFHLIQANGFATLGWIVAAAGVMQFAAGSLGGAALALMISPALIQAMLAGIGALIILAQTQVILGFKPAGNGPENILLLIERIPQAHAAPLLLGLAALAILFGWEKIMKQMKVQWLPAPLVAVTACTAIAHFSGFSPEQLPFIHLSSSLWVKPDAWAAIPLGLGAWKEILPSALAVAFVASAESLLCAVASDQLHSGPRSDLDKELRAQGMGNFVSGLLGGLPVTGVIVRTTANINAGAKSRLSAILHGIWILVFSTFFVALLNKIPFSVLAAVLIVVGVKLLKIKEFKRSRAFGEGWVYLGTFAGVVGIDLLWGIGIGLLITLFQHLRQQASPRLQVSRNEDESWDVTFSGNLNVFSVPAVLKNLNNLPSGASVRIEAQVDRIDYAAIHAIRSWKQSHEAQGGTVTKPDFNIIFRNQYRFRDSGRSPEARA